MMSEQVFVKRVALKIIVLKRRAVGCECHVGGQGAVHDGLGVGQIVAGGAPRGRRTAQAVPQPPLDQRLLRDPVC